MYYRPCARAEYIREEMASVQYLSREKTRMGKFQIVLSHQLKKQGYIPKHGSEIFFTGVPKHVTEWDLAEFFNKAGEIFQLRLMVSDDYCTNRGFGYVTYMNPATAKKAVQQLEKNQLMGKELKMELSMDNCRIFMSGFSTNLTKDQIWMELLAKGVKNIVDIIMYRSYTDRAKNRGFVFVEFQTHEQAASVRAKFHKNLTIHGKEVIVDWSVPLPEVEEEVMQNVKIIYLRNLEVNQTQEELKSVLVRYVVNPVFLNRVHKFKNYAFIHLATRDVAEKLMDQLKEHYKYSVVEVEWAKPPNRFTSPEYRHGQISNMNRRTPRCPNCSAHSADRSPSISPVEFVGRRGGTSSFSEFSCSSFDEELQMSSGISNHPRFQLDNIGTRFLDDFGRMSISETPHRYRTSTPCTHTKTSVEAPVPFYPRLNANYLEMGTFPVATPSVNYITQYNDSLVLPSDQINDCMKGNAETSVPRPVSGYRENSARLDENTRLQTRVEELFKKISELFSET